MDKRVNRRADGPSYRDGTAHQKSAGEKQEGSRVADRKEESKHKG